MHKTETQDVRRRFSLSQKAMADYLGISGSLFAMFERGKRELKPAVFDKLIALQEMLMNSTMASGEPVPPVSVQARLAKHRKALAAKLRSDAKFQQQEMVVLKGRMNSLDIQIDQYTAWMNILEETVASLPANPASKGDRMWFGIQLDDTYEKLCAAGEKRLEMELRIGLLESLSASNEAQYQQLIKGL